MGTGDLPKSSSAVQRKDGVKINGTACTSFVASYVRVILYGIEVSSFKSTSFLFFFFRNVYAERQKHQQSNYRKYCIQMKHYREGMKMSNTV